jgi:hypothetical protein
MSNHFILFWYPVRSGFQVPGAVWHLKMSGFRFQVRYEVFTSYRTGYLTFLRHKCPVTIHCFKIACHSHCQLQPFHFRLDHIQIPITQQFLFQNTLVSTQLWPRAKAAAAARAAVTISRGPPGTTSGRPVLTRAGVVRGGGVGEGRRRRRRAASRAVRPAPAPARTALPGRHGAGGQ